MGKEIFRSFKYNRSKISTPKIKNPMLYSFADHTSYTSNLTRNIISYQLENENSTAIQNMTDITNTYDIHSCVTPWKQNISVQAPSTPPQLTPWTTTLPIVPVELPKTMELPPVSKEYLCFQVNRKYPHADQCVIPTISWPTISW